ncbi:alpha/beta hydrolase [Mycoplana azooxidifex]|nr:alpha/beta hydrolase [Mycoplana azooxidifex]
MRLDQIASLLPYHSEVKPDVVVAGLNRMIEDLAAGHQVFFDIYSEEEKRSDPSKARAGLFFFRGPPDASFAMIAPGGGFAYVGSVHEGFPYANEINACGYNAFVVRYRAGAGGLVATEDMAAALSFVFHNARKLGISTEGYSLWGSSAGARMAASIGSRGVAAFGGDRIDGPTTVVMAYTARAPVEPATFAVVGKDDGIASPATMRRRIDALRRTGTSVEYLEYPRVGHGFGTGAGTSAQGWIAAACEFWKKSMPRPDGKVAP